MTVPTTTPATSWHRSPVPTWRSSPALLPHARVGKAAALNAAFEHVERTILAKPAYSDIDPSRVIFGIVDADGRLAPEAPATVARHFEDPEVGGVQVHVHIYNQTSWLTRMQGLEFRIFGGLYQVGTLLVGHRFPGWQRPVQPHDRTAQCGQRRRALVALPDRGSGTGIAMSGPWVARRTRARTPRSPSKGSTISGGSTDKGAAGSRATCRC
ncbi:MAG: glycosyltransferase family 2 protein [Candidatus Nanopelagicales bacterium]